jgi:hypothetical protein
MSIVAHFIFCMETETWSAPAVVDKLPLALISDEI